MSRTKTYDTKCYDLAEHLLQDAPAFNTELQRRALAGLIQSVIDQHIGYQQVIADREAAAVTT